MMRSEPRVLIQYIGKQPATGGATSLSLAKAQADFNKAQKAYNDLVATGLMNTDANVRVAVEQAAGVFAQAQLALAAAQSAAAAAPKEPAPPVEPEGIDLSSRLLSFSFEDSEKKTDLCKMTFDNKDLALFDDKVFEKGNVLNVQWGYATNMSPVHEVVVQKCKGSLRLSVEAQDRGVLMNKKARSRTFENMTRSAVVKQVAGEQGYEGERLIYDQTAVTYPCISQASQTDAQFLKKLADQEGFEFFVDGDGMHWHARKVDQKPMRVLQYYLPPDVGDITDFDVENDVSGKPGTVTVKGRDPMSKTDIEHTASDSTTPRSTTAPAPEVPSVTVDPRTGEATSGKTSSGAATATANAATETRPTSEPTAAGAKREADGVYRRTQQTSVKLTVNMVGDPSLAAKSIVEVRGLGMRLSGKYYVTEAVHTVDSGGYKLKLVTKSDGTNKGGKAAASKAVPNTKDGPATTTPGTDPAALETTVVVDPRTGEQKIVYKDTRGKGAP